MDPGWIPFVNESLANESPGIKVVNHYEEAASTADWSNVSQAHCLHYGYIAAEIIAFSPNWDTIKVSIVCMYIY